MQTSSETTLNLNSHQFPAGVNPKLSREIAQKLSKGQIITKEVYHRPSSQLRDSQHYTTLFNNYDFYKDLYVHMGWHLVHDPDGEFFALAKVDDDMVEEGDLNSLRVCIPLFYIADYFVKRGISPDVLWTPHIGMTEDELQELIDNEPEKVFALETLKFKNPDVWRDAIKNLEAKGFVYRNSNDSIVFSSAARWFEQNMIEKFAI